MSEGLHGAVKDELQQRAAEATMKAAERTLEKVMQISSGSWPFGKKVTIRLSFGMLFRFSDDPKYDDVAVAFEKALSKFRLPSSNELLEYDHQTYSGAYAVRQKTDAILPFLTGEDKLAFERGLTAAVRAPSAVLYLLPISADDLSFDGKRVRPQMVGTLNFFRDFSDVLANLVPPKTNKIFFKVILPTLFAHMLVERLKESIPSADSEPEPNDNRSVTLSVNDSSTIETLVRAMEKAL